METQPNKRLYCVRNFPRNCDHLLKILRDHQHEVCRETAFHQRHLASKIRDATWAIHECNGAPVFRLPGLKQDLAGHTIDPDTFLHGVFFALIIMLVSKTSSSVTFTSHTFMNFTGDRTHISSAPARRRYARSHNQNSNPYELLGRFPNRCTLQCHSCNVLVRKTPGEQDENRPPDPSELGGFEGDHNSVTVRSFPSSSTSSSLFRSLLARPSRSLGKKVENRVVATCWTPRLSSRACAPFPLPTWRNPMLSKS